MSKAFAYLGLAMSIVFIVMGIIFPFYPPISLGLSQPQNILVGVILVMYGIFRMFRAYTAIKRNRR